MSNWLTQALAQYQSSDSTDWLSAAREKSLQQLHNTAWPTRKTENWRYTPLACLERTSVAEPTNDAFTAESIEGLECIEIVFVNGKLVSELTENIPGVNISLLSGIEESAQNLFQKVKPEHHIFGLVNDVLASTGVVIDVDESVVVDTPVRLVHWQNGGESHVRHLVRVGKGASLAVIEEYRGDNPLVATQYAEYQLEDDAKLNHYRFALHTNQAMVVGGSHFNLSDRSELHSTLIGFGSLLSRVDIDINHCGEHATATQNSVYLLEGKEIFDLHSNVEHTKPNGTTEENIRGIVGDEAKAVFNGRIHIHRHAQKTLAELNNRNLLLTNKAEVNTKPELEIYADDVRCAHGATVAELDTKALYYLRSRGMSEQEARIMLNFGFINELIEQLPLEPLVEWLQGELKRRFNDLRNQIPGVEAV